MVEESRVAVELPQYRCHKAVRAAKITRFTSGLEKEPITLTFDEIGVHKVVPRAFLDSVWLNTRTSPLGGYYVVYDDGYAYFCPAKVFEDNYIQTFV